MDAKVPSGKYVLAVSGGVDSMVLLDLLSNLPGVELVIAHFNHGIRQDGAEDEELVLTAAKKLNLPFEAGRGDLGAGTSEETARAARYGFLSQVRAKHGAKAIITAHHQDDLIETALINLLRGTGRRGLTAISSNKKILRPLLNRSKKEILSYAKNNNLQWREDPTNASQDYLRNYVRHNLVAKMTAAQRRQFLQNLDQVFESGIAIDTELLKVSPKIFNRGIIDRSKFSVLPARVGNELLIFWLRREGLPDFDRPTINRLNVALRTAKGGSVHPIKRDLVVKISPKTAHFEHRPLR